MPESTYINFQADFDPPHLNNLSVCCLFALCWLSVCSPKKCHLVFLYFFIAFKHSSMYFSSHVVSFCYPMLSLTPSHVPAVGTGCPWDLWHPAQILINLRSIHYLDKLRTWTHWDAQSVETQPHARNSCKALLCVALLGKIG